MCAVLRKGRVTFSCVLKVLLENEADFVGAREPRTSPAPGCSWAACAAEGFAWNRGDGNRSLVPNLGVDLTTSARLENQHGDEDVSSAARVDLSWKLGRGEKAFGKLCSRGGQSWCL